ncbi:zinc finger protein-like [Toxorhynchites rutilus septentrionalis]|uniref:zinc finger protein-like n=1 Tax=Toxorhynchites rutilus septentrionalis TaxID=329112 RepID=UPI002479E427|nr:zinc finger protein-like [Toxorhynchites rutilus septentrionalis]
MSICRLCMKSCPKNGVLGNRFFREKVSDVICMWVEIDDDCLSRDVCESCHGQIGEFYNFKQQCRAFQLKFKERMAKISTETSNKPDKQNHVSGDIDNRNALDHSCSKKKESSNKNNHNDKERAKVKRDNMHVEKTTPKKPLGKKSSCVCELCGRAIYISRMEGHKNRHLGLEPYECDVCGDKFSCKYNMRLHWRRNHVQDEQSTCEICGKNFVSRMALKSHLNGVHCERKLQCTMCDVKFHTRYARNAHLKIHNQKRDFKCPLCRKAFYCKSVWNIHMRTHSGEAPYKCDTCSKAFVHRNMYVTHMQKNHPGHPLMYLDGRISFKNTIMNRAL